MNLSKLEKICLFMIRWGSALILLLPLFVYRGVFYPYIFSKIIIFQILVEIIFAAWLVLIVYIKKYRVKLKNPIIISLTIFIIILFLSSLTGVDFRHSFWSSQERMLGLVTLLHFWLWFIILASSLKKWNDWINLIFVNLIISFLVAFYGLGQNFKISFLLTQADAGRMSSTLGNPIFLATYAMLNVFLAAFLFLRENKNFVKIFSAAAFLLNLFIIILTATRAAVAALLISFLIFVIFFIFNNFSKKNKIIFSIVFVLLIVILVSTFIFLQTPTGVKIKDQMPYFLYRFSNIETLTHGIEQRTIPWQIAWQGFLERPILGWGWQNFNIIFNKFYQPHILQWEGESATWFDRSHNQLTDLLSMSGVLGIAAYLVFYSFIFILIFTKLKEFQIKSGSETKKNYFTLLILALMFVAYFIQNLTVFDTPAPLIIFYFGLGLVYFITQRDMNLKIDVSHRQTDLPTSGNNTSNKLQSKQLPLPILILLIIIFIPIIIYQVNIKPFKQSQLVIQAIIFSKIDLKTSLDFYKSSLSKNEVFINPETRVQLAKTISEQQPTNSSYKQMLEFAISEMKKNTNENPLDAHYWLILGQLYNLAANINLASDDLINGELSLKKALDLSPQRQQIYFELAKNKILQKKYDEALKLSQAAVDLDPAVGFSHYFLGLANFYNQKYDELIKNFNDARSKGYDLYQNSNYYLFLSSALFKLGKNVDALNIIDEALAKWPQSINFIIEKIDIYRQEGNQQKLFETINELRKIAPDLANQIEK